MLADRPPLGPMGPPQHHGDTDSRLPTLRPGDGHVRAQSTKACDVEECERPARSNKAPYCETHYYRLRRIGSLETQHPKRPAREICTVEGCNLADCSPRGLCMKHETRNRRHGNPLALVEPENRRLPTGAEHGSWNGSKVTYSGMHQRVAAARGQATRHLCVDCGGQAAHWSYDHKDPEERQGKSGNYDAPYSVKIEHYEPRCVSCHKKHDLSRSPK